MGTLALREAWIADRIGPWSRPVIAAGGTQQQPPRVPAASTRWANGTDAFRYRQGMAAKGSTPEGLAWFLDGDE